MALKFKALILTMVAVLLLAAMPADAQAHGGQLDTRSIVGPREQVGAASLVGTWEGSFTDFTGSTAAVLMTFMPGGTYVQTTYFANGFQFYMSGRYQVLQNGQVLRLTIERYSPTEWCGPLGCNPIRVPDAEHHYLRFYGAQRMTTTPLICQDASCVISYWKTG